jgi:hypothetical protein
MEAHSASVHVGHGTDRLLHGDRSLDLREVGRLDDLVKELVAGPGLEVFVVELVDVPMVRELHGDVLRLRVLAVELEDSP